MSRSSQCLVACVLLCGCGTDEPTPAVDDSTGSATAGSTGLSTTSTGGVDSTGLGSESATDDTTGDSTDGASSSGSTDSGSTDSGSTDSGSTDSGSTDSGSTDSGSTDSGSSDTGSDVSCVEFDAGSELGFVISGAVVGLGDDFDHPCSAISGEDLIVGWTAPYTGVFTFTELIPEAASVLAVIEGGCDGLILACNEALWGFFDGPGEQSQVTLALDEGDYVLIAGTTAVEPLSLDIEIVGEELTPDESCVDQDLGSATGPAAAMGTGPTIFVWTAPSTATYTFSTPSGPDEIEIFRPGCATLSPELITGSSLTGPVPNTPSAFHALDLVAGQTIAIAVGNVGQPFELDITQNGTPGGTCCSPRHGVGCSVPAIEASVCANDAYCCDIRWDFNCSGAAKFAYDANCIGD